MYTRFTGLWVRNCPLGAADQFGRGCFYRVEYRNISPFKSEGFLWFLAVFFFLGFYYFEKEKETVAGIPTLQNERTLAMHPELSECQLFPLLSMSDAVALSPPTYLLTLQCCGSLSRRSFSFTYQIVACATSKLNTDFTVTSLDATYSGHPGSIAFLAWSASHNVLVFVFFFFFLLHLRGQLHIPYSSWYSLVCLFVCLGRCLSGVLFFRLRWSVSCRSAVPSVRL